MTCSRREFGWLALAGAPLYLRAELPAVARSTVNGVRIGAITYSFHDMSNIAGKDHVDEVIADCKACDVHLLELMSNHLEPYMPTTKPDTAEAQKSRDELRQWRLATPMRHFREVKKKFNDAGLTVFAYTVNRIGKDFSVAEMDKVFEQAQTLGATTLSSSTTLDAAQKVVPFAEKHRYPVAFHNHQDVTDPNQFATPDSFARAMKMSSYFRINLDIGYLTGSNYDAVEYIRTNHERITHLHIKDRQKNL